MTKSSAPLFSCVSPVSSLSLIVNDVVDGPQSTPVITQLLLNHHVPKIVVAGPVDSVVEGDLL